MVNIGNGVTEYVELAYAFLHAEVHTTVLAHEYSESDPFLISLSNDAKIINLRSNNWSDEFVEHLQVLNAEPFGDGNGVR